MKIFPCAGKIPLIKNWQQEATNDPEKINLWSNLFRDRLTCWGIPTGNINDLLVLDVDAKDGGLETLKTLQFPETNAQRTPSGGIHFLFSYPKDGKRYGNRTKFIKGCDIRGEGGYICHYRLEGRPTASPPHWLSEAALKADPPPPGASIKVSPDIASQVIQNSLEAIRDASEGTSNDVLNKESFRVGQFVASGSVTREYAEAALLRAALERGKPLYEAKATIASGLLGGSQKPLSSPFGASEPVVLIALPAPPTITRYAPQVFSRADFMNTSRLRQPQLFENWSTQDIHITTADGGTGKSTMKLFEAICLALGERFLGFRCIQPGKTLFITGEDSALKLAAIIGQILRQMGLLEDPQYNDEVQTVLDSVLVKKDADLCLIVKDKATGFLQPNGDALRKLKEAIDDIKPKMIVFDPISSFWGSESALNDMNKAVIKVMSELAEYSGACIEMINHMGKQSSNAKDMSQFAGRGGTGLPSNSRVCRTLRTVFPDEYLEMTGESLGDKQSAMACMVNKFTDGSPLYNKQFLILRDGYLFSRKQLTDAKAKEVENSLSDIERIFQFVKECRQADKFPTVKALSAHFINCGNPIKKASIDRALATLAFTGHMGELVKTVENPDQTSKDKVYVITDTDGKET